jgi:hypothetical protein
MKKKRMELVNLRTSSPSMAYEPYRSGCFCTKYRDRSDFQNILSELQLTNVQKEIIKTRYLHILENFQRRTRNYSIIFFFGHFIITVGSLLVPALMSIQNSDKDMTFSGINFPVHMYWATFVISVLVTTFNGILTLFKVDKKYYFLNTTLERLRSEGWQYFSLTGRYSGHLIQHQQPTHANQFMFFTHYVEKIKMKQVEEEYYKADEKPSQTPTGSNHLPQSSSSTQELYPPSPDQPIQSMIQNIPEPVKEAVNTLIKSSKTMDAHDKEHNVIVIPTAAPEETAISLDSIEIKPIPKNNE